MTARLVTFWHDANIEQVSEWLFEILSLSFSPGALGGWEAESYGGTKFYLSVKHEGAQQRYQLLWKENEEHPLHGDERKVMGSISNILHHGLGAHGIELEEQS